jgi:NTP pyrophosphatase (non-canonical NTP hydrolase)
VSRSFLNRPDEDDRTGTLVRRPFPCRYGGGVSGDDDDPIWSAVDSARKWLDRSNGTLPLELTCRILKVTEEAGEAAQAWIGLLGQNPRKGVTHTRDQVAAELADVAFTALVAIASLDVDPHVALSSCAVKVEGRFPVIPH